MSPKIGCNVSYLSQLVPVKTRIPLKTYIIKQYAPFYIQQKPKSEHVSDCLHHNNKCYGFFSQGRHKQ